MTSKITPNNYGDAVEYSANGLSDWKIFYNDNNNVFLILGDYLDSSKLPAESNMMLFDGFTDVVSWPQDLIDNKEVSINKEVASNFKFGWLNDNLTSTNENIRAISTLLDTKIWENFVDSNYAEDAIGTPTLEMFVDSWNSKGYEKLYCNSNNENGYFLGTTDKPTTDTVNISKNSLGYVDKLYFPQTTSNASNNESAGYWIASPSSYSHNALIHVRFTGEITWIGYNFGVSLRPVIRLKANVNGTQSPDGVWVLSN